MAAQGSRAVLPTQLGSLKSVPARRATWAAPSLLEMICQEREDPATCIFGSLSIVLRPMPEHHSPGLEDFHIEGMVSARIGDELDGRSRISPVRQRPRAVVRGC